MTSHRILVLDSGLSTAKAKAVLGELPRVTRLGPTSGVRHPMALGGSTLRVRRRYFKDTSGAGLPPPRDHEFPRDQALPEALDCGLACPKSGRILGFARLIEAE